MQPSDLAKAIVVAAEVIGHELSPTAAVAIARQLADESPEHIANALNRCQRECKGRLTLAAIIERLPGQHPGPEEAWSIASRSFDESATVVWTDEIAEAFGVARQVVNDPVGQRMAFREAYTRIVAEASSAGCKPCWWPSMGDDRAGRLSAVRDAVAAGRLREGECAHLLPPEAVQPMRLASGEAATVGDALAAWKMLTDRKRPDGDDAGGGR